MSRASIISALQSIITNANATTGQSDATVTSATDRLIRGYGGGASNIIADVEVTGDGTEHLSFECSEEPDAVIIYPINWEWTETTESALTYCAVKTKFVLGMRRTNKGKGYAGASEINDTTYPWGNAGGNYTVAGSYAGGTFDAYSRGVAAQCKWQSVYTYRCIGIKF